MDKRFTLFAILAITIVFANQIIYNLLFPPDPAKQPPAKPPAKVAKADPAKTKPAEDKPADGKPASDKPTDAAIAEPQPKEEQPAVAAAEPAAEQATAVANRWISLGSAAPDSPYRMLVTLTNAGAAIERVEFSSPNYRDLEDRSGYFGHLATTNAPSKGGALVRAVGPGTPAALAGVQVDDVITGVADHKVTTAAQLIDALRTTRPLESVRISVNRGGAEQQLTATLGRRPLEVIRPEWNNTALEVVTPKEHDPFSFLMTVQQFDDRVIGDDNRELGGVNLRDATWEVVSADEKEAIFRTTVPKFGLQITKTFRLDKVPDEQVKNVDYPGYSLSLEVSIANTGSEAHRVAYRLDGPNGLPLEGAWYASKVGRGWSAAGLRDVIARFQGGSTTEVTCAQIADPEFKRVWTDTPLNYIAVDGIYFSAALIPQKENPNDVWFAEVRPTRVGAVPTDKAFIKLTNVSFSLDSTVEELAPGGAPLKHRFQIFAGPKRPGLLQEYRAPGTDVTLYDLLYYGWFAFVARPMLAILHGLHYVVGNYGIAIILLTVLVRGFMLPLGRKQAMSAAKMQELQPEIKRLNEKYKSEPDKKAKAQQELFRSHNYNPLGGCLLAFVQLPIFVGLYRSLQVDVELRQAPLFGEGIRWASNLAAPDMLWDWSNVVPHFVAFGTGFFGLGPYFNLFPILSIAMILISQKVTMPPPTDEQGAMQQKMMQYMMVFMGVLFFKWASGLCLYTIVSSLWGIGERKLLPKAAASPSGPGGSSAPPFGGGGSSGNGSPGGKKRQRGRK